MLLPDRAVEPWPSLHLKPGAGMSGVAPRNPSSYQPTNRRCHAARWATRSAMVQPSPHTPASRQRSSGMSANRANSCSCSARMSDNSASFDSYLMALSRKRTAARHRNARRRQAPRCCRWGRPGRRDFISISACVSRVGGSVGAVATAADVHGRSTIASDRHSRQRYGRRPPYFSVTQKAAPAPPFSTDSRPHGRLPGALRESVSYSPRPYGAGRRIA
jgi:hypothetical protein